MWIVDLILGKRLATTEGEGERVGTLSGVPILGLDALSSAAYGPEALLTVLLALGTSGLRYLWPLTLCIVALLAIVYLSYLQTIQAYPNGGGAYTVARENLGTGASLFAAASLALDYLLNVAVAISAGVGALVSAVPRLLPHTLPLCLVVLLLLTVLNLRGVRATGLAFLVPSYLFIGCLCAVIAVGGVQALMHHGHPVPVIAPVAMPAMVTTASGWLLLRAFASGCTAMTGVEAISNGVPIFRRPAPVRARWALTVIVSLLIALLLGIALLCRAYGVTATPPGETGYRSVLSQLANAAVGNGPFYYLTIGSVITVLSLSANTSFADFPRLCRLLALDGFLPEHFIHRGRRLTFSHGIYALSILSALLLVVFRGITDALIPLFAVGAFSAFTLSQTGMVVHWRKRSGAHARRSLALNALGAAATAVTAGVMVAAKFTEGAWLSVLLVLAIVVLCRRVRRHHDFVGRATATSASLAVGPTRPPIAVVPIRRWDAIALKALSFAVGIAPEVVAVQVLTDDRRVDDLTQRWAELVQMPAQQLGLPVPRLVVLQSEYRQLFVPLLDFVGKLTAEHPDRQVAVVVPELMEARWYHYLLRGQTASVLKMLLLMRGGPQVVVVTTPWYLGEWVPERRHLLSARTGPLRRALRRVRLR